MICLLTSSSDEGDESAVAESFACATFGVERRNRLLVGLESDFEGTAKRFRCLLDVLPASCKALIDAG